MIEPDRLKTAMVLLANAYREVNRAGMEYFLSAKDDGKASDYLKAFRAIRDVVEYMDEANKYLAAVGEDLKKKYLPEAYENEDISTLTGIEGDRVTVSQKVYASVIAEKRPQAYDWLRSQKDADGNDRHFGDIIVETINASTLSAFAKKLLEEENLELPEEFFRVHSEGAASLTRGKYKLFDLPSVIPAASNDRQG